MANYPSTLGDPRGYILSVGNNGEDNCECANHGCRKRIKEVYRIVSLFGWFADVFVIALIVLDGWLFSLALGRFWCRRLRHFFLVSGSARFIGLADALAFVLS